MHKIDDHPYTNDTITKTHIDQSEICPHIAILYQDIESQEMSQYGPCTTVRWASAKKYYKYSTLDSTK